MSTATVHVPSLPVAPRGAQLVGLVYDLASRVLMRLHRYQDGRRAWRRALDAENVRRIAASYEASDPGMAADLRAAADRHTGGW